MSDHHLPQDEERNQKKDNVDRLIKLLRSADKIDENTQWKDLESILEKISEYKKDKHLQKMDPLDKLIAFEDVIKDLERKTSTARNQQKGRASRTERKNRDAFKVRERGSRFCRPTL